MNDVPRLAVTAAQEYIDGHRNARLDLLRRRHLFGAGQNPKLELADQHIEEERGKLRRVAWPQVASLLLLGNPFGDVPVGIGRAGPEKSAGDSGERSAE